MDQTTAFADRVYRLEQITSKMEIRDSYPLLKIARLNPAAQIRLSEAVNNYLYSCLENFYIDQNFDKSESLFDTRAQQIRQLPNITPNGLVLPKKPICMAYNIIHAIVAEIIDDLGLQPHIEKVHAPINIRLVDGAGNRLIDERPRASTKMHSDMWAGEAANAIMIFLPIFGNYQKIGIKWIEPREFPVDYMRPLKDFNEGIHLIRGGREYGAILAPGDIVLADPFLIHATQKDANSLRLSIDFRFITTQVLDSDNPAPGTRRQNYLVYEEWIDIGKRRILETDAPLVNYDDRVGATKDEYAAPYEIKVLDD